MRSLRLDPDLDARVQRAAAMEESSVSEFLRQAAAERAERTLGEDPRQRLAYAIGTIETGLAQARDAGRAFTDVVDHKHRRKRK
jgi:predicted transcriptional regulator